MLFSSHGDGFLKFSTNYIISSGRCDKFIVNQLFYSTILIAARYLLGASTLHQQQNKLFPVN